MHAHDHSRKIRGEQVEDTVDTSNSATERQNTITISSSVDKLDEKNNEIHEDTLDMINTVDSKYRNTLLKLRRTVDGVSELEGQVEDSLRELNFFFLGMGKVAADAFKEFDEFRI
jgi:hypothetical protein